MHPKFLTDLRKVENTAFKGLSGKVTSMDTVGHLEEFFYCLACNSCTSYILSQSDIEAKYEITYEPGLNTSFTYRIMAWSFAEKECCTWQT